jgi:hypothetical protein
MLRSILSSFTFPLQKFDKNTQRNKFNYLFSDSVKFSIWLNCLILLQKLIKEYWQDINSDCTVCVNTEK